MTFDAKETSADGGAPIELYDFQRGGDHYRYTSADRDITLGTDLYLSTALERSDVESSTAVERANMTITAPRDLGVAQLFNIVPPSDPVILTLRKVHDTDVDLQAVVHYKGRLRNVKWGASSCDLLIDSVFTALRRVGLRRAYQKTCPHVLYGTECGLNASSFVDITTVSSVAGLTITAPAFGSRPAGYFAGGFLELAVGGHIERRAIVAHPGATVDISHRLPELAAGLTINAYPGCDHTTGANGCTKFANVVNFGGMPYIPVKNPFAGDPVY